MNVLKKIIDKKKEKIVNLKKKYSINSLLDNISNINNFINFKDVMKKRTAEKKISIIAEIKKLNILLNDKKLARKMGEAGRKRASMYFSWENIAKNFIDILNSHSIGIRRTI